MKRHRVGGKEGEPSKRVQHGGGTEDKERERQGGRIGLKFSDNETSPVIVPAVINGVPSYSGSPCPWE